MNPSVRAVIQNEWVLLKHRRIIWYYWLLSFVGPLLVTMIMEWFIVGAETGLTAALQRNLWIHSLFLIPMLFVFIVGQSIADNRREGVIREAILQGVPRRDLWIGNAITFGGVSGVALLLSAIPALMLTGYTPLGNTLLGYLCYWILNYVLWLLVQLMAFRTQGSGTVVMLYCQWLAVESLVKLALWMGPSLIDNPILTLLGETLPPMMLSTVLNSWMVWEDAWDPSSLGLALLYGILMGWFVIRHWETDDF